MMFVNKTEELALINRSEYDAYIEGSDVYEEMIGEKKRKIQSEKMHDDFDRSVEKKRLQNKKWKQKNPDKCYEYSRRSCQKRIQF